MTRCLAIAAAAWLGAAAGRAADFPGDKLPKPIADAEADLMARAGSSALDEYDWTPLPGAATATSGAKVAAKGPGAWTVAGPVPDTDTYAVAGAGKFPNAAALMVAFPNKSRRDVFVAIGEVFLTIDGAPVKFAQAYSDTSHATLYPSYAIDGSEETNHLPAGYMDKDAWLVLTLPKPLPAKALKAAVRLCFSQGKGNMPGQFRLAFGIPKPPDKASRAAGLKRFHDQADAWAKLQKPLAWTAVRPAKVRAASGAKATIQRDKSVALAAPPGGALGDETVTLECVVKAPRLSAFRLEFLPDAALPGFGPGRAPGGALTIKSVAVAANERGRVALAGIAGWPNASATLDAQGALAAPLAFPGGAGTPTVVACRAADALVGDRPWKLAVQVATAGAGPGRLRLSVGNLPADAVLADGLSAEVEEALAAPAERRTAEQLQRLRRHYLLSAPELQPQRQELDGLRAKWRGAGG